MKGTASRKSLRTGMVAIATGAVACSGFTTAVELFGACNCSVGAGRPDDSLQHGLPPAAASVAAAGRGASIVAVQQSWGVAEALVGQFASPAAGITSTVIATSSATNLEKMLTLAST